MAGSLPAYAALNLAWKAGLMSDGAPVAVRNEPSAEAPALSMNFWSSTPSPATNWAVTPASRMAFTNLAASA